MTKSSSIFVDIEQNRPKTKDVSTLFIKDSKFMGPCTKYSWYQDLTEAISNPSAEAVTASVVLLLHISTFLSHIYNSNSKDVRNLQPSLFQTLL